MVSRIRQTQTANMQTSNNLQTAQRWSRIRNRFLKFGVEGEVSALPQTQTANMQTSNNKLSRDGDLSTEIQSNDTQMWSRISNTHWLTSDDFLPAKIQSNETQMWSNTRVLGTHRWTSDDFPVKM